MSRHRADVPVRTDPNKVPGRHLVDDPRCTTERDDLIRQWLSMIPAQRDRR